MSTDTKAPSAGAMGAAREIHGPDHANSRTSGRQETLRLRTAKIIDREVAELVEALEATNRHLKAWISPNDDLGNEILQLGESALRRFKEGL